MLERPIHIALTQLSPSEFNFLVEDTIDKAIELRDDGDAGILERNIPETELATRKGGELLRLVEALACGFSFGQDCNKDLLVGYVRRYANLKTAGQGISS